MVFVVGVGGCEGLLGKTGGWRMTVSDVASV